jgi:hypothetical protein
MKFFVPAARDDAEAESVLKAIEEFNHAPRQIKRIDALAWQHNGEKYSCEVGGEAPTYYGTETDPVVAILECGELFKVCTINRGVVRGEAILVGKSGAHPTYFEGSLTRLSN